MACAANLLNAGKAKVWKEIRNKLEQHSVKKAPHYAEVKILQMLFKGL